MKFIICLALLAMTALVTFAQDTTQSPEDAKRAEINAVIATLHESCKRAVAAQTTGHETLQQGCHKLESFKALLGLVGCQQDDYDKLHAVICYLNGVYVG